MHLIIDHFDSFTYNLVQMLAELTRSEVKVVRHDALPLAEIVKLPLESIVFSPGPGIPDEYPESQNIIRALLGRVPILGVCLGHELLVAATGGRIRRGNRIMHGKTDEILQDGRGCFRNLPSPSHFVRYHSLVADPDLPECLEASAWSRLDGDIMAVRHRTCQAEGLQFHPESIGSELGRRVMLNFLNYRREPFPARKVLGDILHGDNIGRQTAYELMLEMAEGNISD
ncbi:MAG: gamma-glutamyl-gamma-aminobutyrate hydrolase family protein, partial [Planctomycetota bacterium]|nr:gamma-glutamyl-gamma-aminobutyrate hydrolase family protein [Planctomycetota bacterium]